MPDAGTAVVWSGRKLAGEILSLSGVLFLAGALVALLTGEEVTLRGGGTMRTHQDAVIVLLVLGVVLLVNAFMLVVLERGSSPTESDRRSDWE